MIPAKSPKPICFYLPQFHQIRENDEWWGKGFTEWTLVDAAQPQFENHQHPRTPHHDIGRYDLTDPQVRRFQGELAKKYGIYGFCYYHYWFGGKRLLETPLELMLQDGYPDINFSLCWANEPWSRRWSGRDQDVLQPQIYGEQDDWTSHFEELYRFFKHKNYIRVDDKPMFAIYRIGHIPNAEKMIAHWRKLAKKKNLPGLHIVAIEGGFLDNQITTDYVDAVAEHHPSCVLRDSQPLHMKQVNVLPVEQVWRQSLAKTKLHEIQYRGACYAWDNTPRCGKEGFVVLPSRPERFTKHLTSLFQQISHCEHEPFVFINAWNEWSEGASLEPDTHHGYQWLESIKQALDELKKLPDEITEKEQNQNKAVGMVLSAVKNRVIPRTLVQPDVDLINALVLLGCRAKVALDFGCAQGATSEHIRDFIGAERYIGLEHNLQMFDDARKILSEVYAVNADNPDLSIFKSAGVDFIVCNELINRVANPLSVLREFLKIIDSSGTILIGFENAGHHSNINQILSGESDSEIAVKAARKFTLNEARALVQKAGYRIVKYYQIFDSRNPLPASVKPEDNRVVVGSIKLSGLSAKQVESLFCTRFFLILNPTPKLAERNKLLGKTSKSKQTSTQKPDALISRISTVISPSDRLFGVYRDTSSENDYYLSAVRQMEELESLYSKHTGGELSKITSLGDYACHFGRLLRVARAMLPCAELCAYDIDAEAIEFCRANFDCVPCPVNWHPDEKLKQRHQLLTCSSLVTHTSFNFYSNVLQKWEKLLLPGGLLCFTYLGDDYISKWLHDELLHYGKIDPEVRIIKAKDYQTSGHAFAGFETPYSEEGAYGVGFMSELSVKGEIDKYSSLEYLGTIPGDETNFNQDLAIVRKVF